MLVNRSPALALALTLAASLFLTRPVEAGTVPTLLANQVLLWDDPTPLPPSGEFGATLAATDGADGSLFVLVGAPNAGAAQLFELPPGTNLWTSHPPIQPTSPQKMPVALDFYALYAGLDPGGATTSIRRTDGQAQVSGIDGAPVSALVTSGTTLAIGQPDYFGGSGRVRIYEQTGPNAWVHAKTFVGGFPDRLGSSLAIDGPVIVAGAPGRGDNGAVYAFARATSWIELQVIDSPAAGQTEAGFGWAVALDGDLLAIGSPYLDRTTAPGELVDAGGVYVYEVITFPFLEFDYQALLRPPGLNHGDRFGQSVDLAASATGGVELVAGAPGEDNSGPNTGAVYRYLRTSHPHASSWHLVSRLVNFDPLDEESLGQTVALGEAGVFAGAPSGLVGEDVSEGRVLFFDFRLFADGFESGDTSAWTESFP